MYEVDLSVKTLLAILPVYCTCRQHGWRCEVYRAKHCDWWPDWSFIASRSTKCKNGNGYINEVFESGKVGQIFKTYNSAMDTAEKFLKEHKQKPKED